MKTVWPRKSFLGERNRVGNDAVDLEISKVVFSGWYPGRSAVKVYSPGNRVRNTCPDSLVL